MSETPTRSDPPMDSDPPPAEGHPDQAPEVFAVQRTGGKVSFSRRGFLELAAASATLTTLAGCDAGDDATATSAPPTPTGTAPPRPTATATAVPPPECVVQPTSINLRAGPGTNYPVLQGLKQRDRLTIVARNPEGTWIEVQTGAGRTGWVAASIVECSSPVEAIPVEPNIPPSPTPAPPTAAPEPTAVPPPPGEPGDVPAGQEGSSYSINGQTFHLPCGSPLPAGAVCICNCVAGQPSNDVCQCDTICHCDSVCGCDDHSSSYWYPN